MTIQGQNFTLDPKVNELSKQLRKRVRTKQQRNAAIYLPLWVAAIAMCTGAACLVAPAEFPSVNMWIGIVGGVCTIAIGIGCYKVFPNLGTPEVNKADQERKASRRSMKRSVRAARTLGESIPVLTESHVRAGIKFDQYVADRADQWNTVEANAVRTLLLSDLSKEAAILSLVGERCVTTADEVFEAIAKMESNTKPLQEGWL